MTKTLRTCAEFWTCRSEFDFKPAQKDAQVRCDLGWVSAAGGAQLH